MTTEPTPTSTRTGPRAADAAAVAFLVVLATALGAISMYRRPDKLYDFRFLFDERGLNLTIVDRILHGGLLYRDLTIPYGALSTYVHVLFALVLGNGMATFVIYSLALSVAFLVLCYAAMRRQVGVGVALAVAVLGLIPTSLMPVGTMSEGLHFTYPPLERCTFALAFLFWDPLTRRSAGRSLLLGAILGLSQWVKFGGAFFVGAPIALLDLVVLLGARADGATRLRWLRSTLAVALGFLIMEGTRDLLALALLPRPVAVDMIWPGYTLVAYRTMLTDVMFNEPAYPQWWGWKYFAYFQLNVVSALAVGLAALGVAIVGLARSLRSRDEPGIAGEVVAPYTRLDAALAQFRVLLPLLFYMLGSAKYFGHVFIFMKYYCFLMIPAAAWLARRGTAGRVALLLLWLPPCALTIKLTMNPIEPGWQRLELPDGQSIYLSPDERDDVEQIFRELPIDPSRKADPPEPIIVAPVASGFGLFYGFETPPRNASLIPEYVRPYDVPGLAERLESARAILIGRWMTDRALENYLDRTFEPSLRAILARREVRRVRINGRRTILILK